MDANDVRAAAERLLDEVKQHKELGGWPDHEYPSLVDDIEAVARYVLARPQGWRADDDEPVTHDYAERIAPGGLLIGTEQTFCVEVRPWAIRIASYTVIDNPTRGHVRRLAAALGIELKEPLQ